MNPIFLRVGVDMVCGPLQALLSCEKSQKNRVTDGKRGEKRVFGVHNGIGGKKTFEHALFPTRWLRKLVAKKKNAAVVPFFPRQIHVQKYCPRFSRVLGSSVGRPDPENSFELIVLFKYFTWEKKRNF